MTPAQRPSSPHVPPHTESVALVAVRVRMDRFIQVHGVPYLADSGKPYPK